MWQPTSIGSIIVDLAGTSVEQKYQIQLCGIMRLSIVCPTIPPGAVGREEWGITLSFERNTLYAPVGWGIQLTFGLIKSPPNHFQIHGIGGI